MSNKKDLKGFEEVSDLSEPVKSGPEPTNNESFALYNFLANEKKRLEIIDDILGKKFSNLKLYPQTENLILRETYKKNMTRDRILNILKPSDSPFNKQCSQIFDSFLR